MNFRWYDDDLQRIEEHTVQKLIEIINVLI